MPEPYMHNVGFVFNIFFILYYSPSLERQKQTEKVYFSRQLHVKIVKNHMQIVTRHLYLIFYFLLKQLWDIMEERKTLQNKWLY